MSPWVKVTSAGPLCGRDALNKATALTVTQFIEVGG